MIYAIVAALGILVIAACMVSVMQSRVASLTVALMAQKEMTAAEAAAVGVLMAELKELKAQHLPKRASDGKFTPSEPKDWPSIQRANVLKMEKESTNGVL